MNEHSRYRIVLILVVLVALVLAAWFRFGRESAPPRTGGDALGGGTSSDPGLTAMEQDEQEGRQVSTERDPNPPVPTGPSEVPEVLPSSSPAAPPR